MALSKNKSQKQKVTPEVQCSDVSDSENSSTDADHVEGNAGWADSIAKVLNTSKPKSKKILVLSRAKKNKPGDKKETKHNYGFEVEGEVKEEMKPIQEELEGNVKQRKNAQLALRVKPSWKDVERERTLRKIATRGVVQLFNAVRIQQKDLQQQLSEAGPLDSRKDAVLNNINKRKFLDVLMSGKRAKSESVDNAVKYEFVKKEEQDDGSSDENNESDKKKRSEWNVLREDFMTNKKMKHWDEEDEDEEAISDECDNNRESDESDQ